MTATLTVEHRTPKTRPTGTPLAPETRAATLGHPTSIDRDARTLEMTITTPAQDRQGDIIEPTGLDFTNYLKNPVILWAHDLAAPPLAKTLSITVSGHGVIAKIRFADTAFAREVFDLYADGFLNAWSIGFIPRRWERLDAADESAGGFRILEAEVVEISAVPVPANPEALTRELPKLKSYSLRKHLEFFVREQAEETTAAPLIEMKPSDEMIHPSTPCGCEKSLPNRDASGNIPAAAFTVKQCLQLADTLVTHLTNETVKSTVRRLRGILA